LSDKRSTQVRMDADVVLALRMAGAELATATRQPHIAASINDSVIALLAHWDATKRETYGIETPVLENA
jgi:hypothetical protein